MTGVEHLDRARHLAATLREDFLGAMIVVTTDGTIQYWNDGAHLLYGYTGDEILGRTLFETIVPSDPADEKTRRLDTATAAGSAIYESVRRRKDGTLVWVDVVGRVVSGDDGITLIALSERDITRIKYRRDAQVLQTRFREVLEAAPDAIVIVDESGRIALINSETERLFAYERNQLLGERMEILVPSRFHAGHPHHRKRYFAERQTRPMGIGLDLWGRRSDGTEFPVEISLSPLTVDGSPLAMAAVRDVSGRKRIEEALKIANEELESFTYSVSHDLRAPIRQIDGFARILNEHLDATLDDKGRHYLQRIQDGALHMGRLVDDLLHLARVGRQSPQLRQVALGTVVASVIADNFPEVPERQIEWRVAPLPEVRCDPGLMKVVFSNLLSNAVKYTRDRPHAIIEIGETERDGQTAVFVRDNGVGFDMTYADKLFGVFQRLHRVEDFEGTGVGLATVQRIVHKHGGRIWAEAQPDEGATFTFTLGPQPAPDGSA
jgi:PAS domain S-box-containing protein